MATVETVYLGNLRTEATHVQSQTKILTDAPVDNQGKGEAFSPTDLLVASLTSCMLTIMGIVSKKHDIPFAGIQVETTKIMQVSPRKVSEIHVMFHFPVDVVYNNKEKALLKKAAETCPVYLSLASDIKKVVTFNWIS